MVGRGDTRVDLIRNGVFIIHYEFWYISICTRFLCNSQKFYILKVTLWMNGEWSDLVVSNNITL